MLYSFMIDDAIAKIKEKLGTINDQTHIILVLYKGQVYYVHNTYEYKIHLAPLSLIFYQHPRDEKMWIAGDLVTIDASARDPELLSVVDQVIENKPVQFEYVSVPIPRYSTHQKYYVRRIIDQRNDNEQENIYEH